MTVRVPILVAPTTEVLMPAMPAMLGLGGLSVEERMMLLEELWDSLSADPEQLSVPESQKADLDKRLAAFVENPKAGSSWEDVKARLKGQP